MANIVWKIEWMRGKPTFDQYQNVVIECGWNCTGTETYMSDTYISSETGTSSFLGISSSFTPYQDLTEQQVLEWVWNSGVNKQAVETTILRDISAKINPPVIDLPLPWNE